MSRSNFRHLEENSDAPSTSQVSSSAFHSSFSADSYDEDFFAPAADTFFIGSQPVPKVCYPPNFPGVRFVYCPWIAAPEPQYQFPPLEEYKRIKEIIIDLLGWGVPTEYIVKQGIQPQTLFFALSEMNLRLPQNLPPFWLGSTFVTLTDAHRAGVTTEGANTGH